MSLNFKSHNQIFKARDNVGGGGAFSILKLYFNPNKNNYGQWTIVGLLKNRNKRYAFRLSQI